MCREAPVPERDCQPQRQLSALGAVKTPLVVSDTHSHKYRSGCIGRFVSTNAGSCHRGHAATLSHNTSYTTAQHMAGKDT